MSEILDRKRITSLDVEIAAELYPFLVHQARLGENQPLLSYQDLLLLAKRDSPNNATLESCIPVSMGRRLDVIRHFTDDQNLPDLTCLIVNRGTGECGSGFTEHFDPVEAREKVYAFDWNDVGTRFDLYIDESRKSLIKRKKIKRDEAKTMMFAFYSENKKRLSNSSQNNRERIIELIVEGYSAEEAFRDTGSLLA